MIGKDSAKRIDRRHDIVLAWKFGGNPIELSSPRGGVARRFHLGYPDARVRVPRYDLGNRLFELFLDESRKYSGPVFHPGRVTHFAPEVLPEITIVQAPARTARGRLP